MNPFPYIHDHFEAVAVPPEIMDALWASGWRHFGRRFFRYSLQFDDETKAMQTIQPLRIDLAAFTPSKSQRRILAANSDIRWEIIPARADDDVQRLFQIHKGRFSSNVPDSIFDFIASEQPASHPSECLEFRALLGDRLIAASFMALGRNSTSGIYGVFDPEFSRRSPGTLTMLREIEFSRESGRAHYYPGYATLEPSAYDYKKRYSSLEFLDWSAALWFPLREEAQQRLRTES